MINVLYNYAVAYAISLLTFMVADERIPLEYDKTHIKINGSYTKIVIKYISEVYFILLKYIYIYIYIHNIYMNNSIFY